MRSFTYSDNDVAATGTWGKKKDVIKNANKQRSMFPLWGRSMKVTVPSCSLTDGSVHFYSAKMCPFLLVECCRFHFLSVPLCAVTHHCVVFSCCRLPHRALSPTFHIYSDMLASDL